MFPIYIESERFFLRTLTVDDATNTYQSWLRDPETNKYILSATDSTANNLSILAKYISEKNNNDNVIFLGIFTRNNSRHIGNIKFEPIERKNSIAIMGILIGESSWRGKGLAQEILNVTSNWLYSNIGITKIGLRVDHQNSAAIRAYLKAGFIIENWGIYRVEDKDAIPMVRCIEVRNS